MRYHRQVVAYHGCLVERFEDALLRDEHPPPSNEPYDWLGRGIYFWEQGPHRALDWARRKAVREGRPVEDARVLGAVINLGVTFDLLDIEATEELGGAFLDLENNLSIQGLVLPRNEAGHPRDADLIKRHLDCAVINFAVQMAEKNGRSTQTVRAAFWEGGPAWPGGAIQKQSHIQIAVRDSASILHYFNGAVDADRRSPAVPPSLPFSVGGFR